jgi:23S rRNA (uracil1939-C5)-methyltransferase
LKQKFTIESLTYGPFALSHADDGQVVFIENACPGDELLAEIYDKRKDFSYAEIAEISKFSELRNPEPQCKLHKICGSCQWQHIDYQAQLMFKKKNLTDLIASVNLDLSYLSATEGEIPDIIGMEEPWNYRNKVCYPVRTVPSTGRLQAGYFKHNSNELINIKYCPIQYGIFDEIIESVKELCSDNSVTDQILRHILLRSNFDKSQILLCLIVKKRELFPETFEAIKEIFKALCENFPALKTCTINYNTLSTNVILGDKTETIIGSGYIYETVLDLKFRISTTSFFQVNTAQFSKIINLIIPELQNAKKILDAYCGAGLISLSMAKQVPGLKIIGVELISSAIKDAQKNAEINNLEAKFVEAKLEDKIDELEEEYDLIIVNPPRKGCSNTVLDTLMKIASPKIIYVSCNPSTLVRDLKKLEEADYKIKSFQGVDMFPHTYHVEAVVVLEKAIKL